MLDNPHREDHEPSGVAFTTWMRSRDLPRASAKGLRDLLARLWPWRFRFPAMLALVAALWYFGTPFLLGPVVAVDQVVRADLVQSPNFMQSNVRRHRAGSGREIKSEHDLVS